MLCLCCSLLSVGTCETEEVRGPASKAAVPGRCLADLGCSKLLLAEGEGATQGGNQKRVQGMLRGAGLG